MVYCISGCSSRGLIEGMMVAGAGGLYLQLGWSNHSDETHLQYVCPFWVNRCVSTELPGGPLFAMRRKRPFKAWVRLVAKCHKRTN